MSGTDNEGLGNLGEGRISEATRQIIVASIEERAEEVLKKK